MKEELSSNMNEEALSTTVKQEEQSSVVTEIKRADETEGATTARPEDGISSPIFSATVIEAEGHFVAKNEVNDV